jgi:Ca-activated chloride channel homolog
MSRIVFWALRIYSNSSLLETKPILSRSIAFLFLFVLIASSIPESNAQTRPRRVGDNKSSAATSPSSISSSPSQPPVLRGATNSTGQSTATKKQSASQGPEEVGEGDIIRVNTTLVTIPVSVMDRDGKYIPNLRKEDFRIWDDGVEQQVAYFASTEQPFTVVLMIDTSGSTHFKLEEMQDAAISFVNQLQPDDRVMVVSFDDKIRFLKDPPTNDRQALRQAILRTRTGGGTRLYDAVDQVINQHLNYIQGRKAIVLFTDGVDTTSRNRSYEDNVRDAEELDALIYPVQFDTYGDMNMAGPWPGSRMPSSRQIILGNILGGIILGGGRGGLGWPGGSVGFPGGGTSREDYRRGDRYLHDLADRTGARVYNADQDLSYAFSQVAEELRRQYSLGYYPKAGGQAGERHQIKIRTNRIDLVVRARNSYVYKSQSGDTAQNPQQPPPVLRRSP